MMIKRRCMSPKGKGWVSGKNMGYMWVWSSTIVLIYNLIFCTLKDDREIFLDIQMADSSLPFLSCFLSFFLSSFYSSFLLCVWLFTTCISVNHKNVWHPQKHECVLECPRNEITHCLWGAMGILRIEPVSSTRAISTPTLWVISPALPGVCFQRQSWLVEGNEQELAPNLAGRDKCN